MPKIIRLNSQQMREWRSNQPVVVDPESNVLRDATQEELTAFAHAQKLNQKLVVEEGEKQCKIISGREAMCEHFLKLHGACQLRRANGTFLATVRDPSKLPPPMTSGPPIATSPDTCQCRDYADREPGKHHKLCQFNPETNPNLPQPAAVPVRAHRQTVPAEDTTYMTKPGETEQPIETGRSEPIQIPSPDVCVCKSFQKPEGANQDEHHPLCEWHEKYLKQITGQADQFIIDLDSEKVVRPATLEEIKQAEVELVKSGSPIITIAGKQYAVGSEPVAPMPGQPEQVKVETVTMPQPEPEVVAEPAASDS